MMYSLPADIARCGGILGGGQHFAYYGQRVDECRDCARRDVRGMDRVVWMAPPELVDGKCPMKVSNDRD